MGKSRARRHQRLSYSFPNLAEKTPCSQLRLFPFLMCKRLCRQSLPEIIIFRNLSLDCVFSSKRRNTKCFAYISSRSFQKKKQYLDQSLSPYYFHTRMHRLAFLSFCKQKIAKELPRTAISVIVLLTPPNSVGSK